MSGIAGPTYLPQSGFAKNIEDRAGLRRVPARGGAGHMVTERTPITTDQMKLVLDVASLLAMTADLDALLTRICTASTSLVSSERASIFCMIPRRENSGPRWHWGQGNSRPIHGGNCRPRFSNQ